jgi:hypothetical protein
MAGVIHKSLVRLSSFFLIPAVRPTTHKKFPGWQTGRVPSLVNLTNPLLLLMSVYRDRMHCGYLDVSQNKLQRQIQARETQDGTAEATDNFARVY